MYLKDYFPNLDKKFHDVIFSGISFDSSKIKKNYIFFALKGNKFDGNDYIEDAIKNGAKIIVSEKRYRKKTNVVFFYSSNARKLLAEISYKMIKNKPKRLVAVTGTNGKSSIADFIFKF